MHSPKKRLVVLTGVTRGLGRALADRLIEAGHTILGCGRDRSQIATLTKRHGKPHDFSPLDVSLDADVSAWAARLLAEYGPPDLLLNNAATINQNAPLWQVPADEFRRVIDVNIVGVTNCIRHFVPLMVKRRRGVIVNFSSG